MQQYAYIESATSVQLCHLISNYFMKNSSPFFLKLGKVDREVTITGREFQVFGPW